MGNKLVNLGKKVLYVVGGLAALIVLLVAATIFLWLRENEVMAVVLGMSAVSVFQVLWTLIAFAVGAYFSFVQLQAGATVAVRSQESDDQRDIAMMNALGKIIDVVIRRVPDINPPAPSPYPTFDRPQDFAPRLQHLQRPMLGDGKEN
jgi:membrane protein implicated in regulation of membrane protease activity